MGVSKKQPCPTVLEFCTSTSTIACQAGMNHKENPVWWAIEIWNEPAIEEERTIQQEETEKINKKAQP